MVQSLVKLRLKDTLFLGPVNTYPGIFESTTFFFWIRLPSARIRWNQHTNPQLSESALQGRNFWIRYESGIVRTLNPDIFLSCDVTRSSPVLYREHCIQDGNLVPRFPLLPVFTTHALLPIFPEESWVLEWIPIRVGYVWTGKFDLNTDTWRRGNVWTRKEKVADSNWYQDACIWKTKET